MLLFLLLTILRQEWMICGIGQKGQQGGYQPDFGSLLPHYKSILIPAIKVLIFK